jgi:PBP1b-binding outer membrane lipoprotein LpoB
MKTKHYLLALALPLMFLYACSSKDGAKSPKKAAEDPFVKASASSFVDSLLVSKAFGIDPTLIHSNDVKAEDPTQKIARFTWRVNDGDTPTALSFSLTKNMATDSLGKTLYTKTLEDLKNNKRGAQRYSPVEGIGTEAVFTNTILQAQTLVFRLENKYLVSLSTSQRTKTPKDYKESLLQLAKYLAEKID